MIKAILVEDQVMLRDSLAMAIDSQDDMQVVAVLGDAADCLERVKALKPDIVILDVCTENGSSGIVAARKVKEAYPDIKTIIMTGMPEITFIEQAQKALVDSFVYKNVGTRELISVIRDTASGMSIWPNRTQNSQELSALTENEIQILRLVCESKSRREIAEELYLSEGTVKRRVSEILAKTGYDSIMKLAVHAVSKGYIVPQITSKDK